MVSTLSTYIDYTNDGRKGGHIWRDQRIVKGVYGTEVIGCGYRFKRGTDFRIERGGEGGKREEFVDTKLTELDS